VHLPSKIPKPNTFRFENAWLLHADFLPTVLPAWHCAVPPLDAAGALAASLKAVRRKAKVWSRVKRSPPQLHHNCRFLIYLLDTAEEFRRLSAGERLLRQLSQDRLALALREQAAIWKQRGKVRAIKESDCNTKFFHANACHRLRQNQIKMIEVDGQPVTAHDAKTAALTSHFQQTLGSPGDASWSFNVEDLYADCPRVSEMALIAPFCSSEALTAVRAMNAHSAPGPDGFGPSFYKAAWNTVQPQLMAFLDAFYNLEAELERVNRSYIVLIPKTTTAVAVTAFRPICLQNCDVKVASKILTSRLQCELQNLISLEQTGFLQGRSISETFIYAMEIVQCCHKRKVPTLVLKLDFAKAFDTVIWDSLQTIMRARGFPDRWCAWINSLLSSSRTAVLVNGTPGPWFTCRKGLRQGDPLSPYLFLLVADVLQQMIQKDPVIKHPISSNQPCPVLQYADDTLILVSADAASVQRLKDLLDAFALATGLHINFHKSTVVPMHVESSILQQCISILGCRQEQFPQSYLGLPLSHEKLKQASFTPMISKADQYLSGWKASLLNTMGRAVLADSVLGNLLVYAMGALRLPKGTLAALEGKRRTFVWTGSEHASGAHCLVAWEHVCVPKELGGLGLKNLSVQNQCLLLKLIHRLHHPGASSWARWARQHVCLASLDGEVQGNHWDTLRELLPLYRVITTVRVHNGRSTSFWDDSWLGDEPLSEIHPALHSHATKPHATVAEVLQLGIDQFLQSRRTTAATADYTALAPLLATVLPGSGEDGGLQIPEARRELEHFVAVQGAHGCPHSIL